MLQRVRAGEGIFDLLLDERIVFRIGLAGSFGATGGKRAVGEYGETEYERQKDDRGDADLLPRQVVQLGHMLPLVEMSLVAAVNRFGSQVVILGRRCGRLRLCRNVGGMRSHRRTSSRMRRSAAYNRWSAHGGRVERIGT